jgi:hypothetical protein
MATYVKFLTESGGAVNSALLTFRQRKREVQCALNLISKLDVFVNEDESQFMQRVETETKELCETPLGAVLLSVVGTVNSLV